MPDASPTRRNPHLLRYLLIGFFTVAPLWVTWLVFDFLFGLLSSTGTPFLKALARLLRPLSDTLAGICPCRSLALPLRTLPKSVRNDPAPTTGKGLRAAQVVHIATVPG